MKSLTRSLRLALYHWKNGQGFVFTGHKVEIPDHIPFGIKKQLMRGTYENAERILVERYLDPSIHLIELGGSLGVLSSLLAKKLAANVRYDIVEANTAIVDVCRRNAQSAKPQCDVHVHNKAIAYGATEVSFHASENVHVSRLGNSGQNGNITVQAVQLSQLLAISGSPSHYTLVMDIEGAEYDVFLNDPAAFETCDLAIIEIHPDAFASNGHNEADFMALVAKAGMKPLDKVENTYAFRKA